MLALSVPFVAIDAQVVGIGFAGELAVRQLLTWRRKALNRAVKWSALASLALAAALAANVWLLRAPPAQLFTALVVRGVLTTVALAALIPAVAEFTGQGWPRWEYAAFIALAILRVALLLATNLVVAHHATAHGLPLLGPLYGVLTYPALALWIAVVYGLANGWADSFERLAFTTGLTIGMAVLILGVATAQTLTGQFLLGLWMLSSVVALDLVAMRRLALAEATERRLALEQAASTAALARTERRSRLALRSGGMGWYEYQPSTRVLTRSPELDAMLGLDPSDVPATIDEGLVFVHVNDRRRFREYVARTEATGTGAAEFRWIHPDGTTVWIETNALAAEGPGGGIEVVGMVKDITERKAAEAELLHQARHDALTGLLNRTSLTDHVSRALDARHQFSLALMDLDGFKDVNDTLGHRVGDAVLTTVTQRFLSGLGKSDVLARFGGDEFVVVLAQSTSRPDVVEVAEQLLDLLDPPVEVDGVAITVRASAGVVSAPEDGRDADTLLRHADAAMNKAKERGRSVHRYAPGDDQGALRRLHLAGQLPAALRSSEIEVHFQPTVELAANRCVVLEALARWHHPEYGHISPSEFVPLAEQYGLGIPLVKRVTTDALAACSHWRAEGLARTVAVNVSPRTLVDPTFLGVVAAALADSGLPPDALAFELTENALAGSISDVRAGLARLDAIGVKVAIDDFGTGYSSLAYLRRLPVHAIKLDRAFADGLGAETANDAIVSLTANLGHRLGLVVIAEGVETAQQFEALRRHGCDVAQGYWICRPGPVGEITHWLTSRASERGDTAAEPNS